MKLKLKKLLATILNQAVGIPGHRLLTYAKDINSSMDNKNSLKSVVFIWMEKLSKLYFSIYGFFINKLYFW